MADAQKVFIPMVDNPTLIGGNGFGAMFITLVKTQLYDLLLKLTAKGTVKRYGKERLLAFYRGIRVAYKLKQVSASIHGDTTTVNYTTTEYATARIKMFLLVVEQDTVRLVLPKDLKTFLK